MARSDAFASPAAAATSWPSLKVTLAPGAFAWMLFMGDEGNQIGWSQGDTPGCGLTALPPGASTCADPPPERMPTSACDPIIAIDWTDGLSGRILFAFFKR